MNFLQNSAYNLAQTLLELLLTLCISVQMQELDTEIIVATTGGTATNAAAVSANVVVDERQMNALFLDVVSYFRFSTTAI